MGLAAPIGRFFVRIWARQVGGNGHQGGNSVTELVREGQVQLMWVSTEDNPSDLLTKAIVSPAKFDKFARWIMGNRDSSVLAFFAGVRRRSVLRVFKSGVEVTRLRLR